MQRRDEIIQPTEFDRLLDRLGETNPQLRELIERNMTDHPELEIGRMLLAGLGAAIGSAYRTIGAGAGGAAGALLYEMLKARYWERRR